MWETDSAGRFAFETRAPRVVLRRAGYRSLLLSTRSISNLRVTLAPLAAKRSFPACLPGAGAIGLAHGSVRLRFFLPSRMEASSERLRDDHWVREYFPKGAAAGKWIQHGTGPLWNFGLPVDLDVWRSVKYSESIYENGEERIIDAQGEWRDGEKWRYLGQRTESASYREMDNPGAAEFDRLMDGACVQRHR